MQDRHGTRVLVVEDERIVARDLQEMLLEMGYDPYAVAASADEAIARAAERALDLALLDIRIRGSRDGITLAGLLREQFGVPVVFLTAHADDATLDRAKRTEPYGYLVKPVKAAELRSAIEIALFRHAMEKRLRESERWFATTLHSIADAVVTVDLAGNVRFMNAAAEALTGVSRADALGRPAREVVRVVAPPEAAAPLERALDARAPISLREATLATAAGPERVIADSVAPVVDRDEMLGAVMVFRDITEHKQLQRQLEVADRLASLGTMAAGVAHEVNNPLSVVIANATYVQSELERLASERPDDGALAEAISAQDDLARAASRIARIVGELRAFAHGEAR